LVVVFILMMLGALLVPTFHRGVELSRQAVCAGNLRHLGGMLYIVGNEQMTGESAQFASARMPLSFGWDFEVHDKGASDYLYCQNTQNREVSVAASLRNVYVRQYAVGDYNETQGEFISYLYDVLIEGHVEDPQLRYTYGDQSNGSYGGWDWVYELNGGPPAENEALISIATCAAFRVTFTETYVEYTPLGHAPHWNSGSHHWIAQGDPTDENGWEEDVLVRLTGMNYEAVNEPVRTDIAFDTDYGMNSLVRPKEYSMDQIVLVEYNKSTIWFDGPTPHEPFDGDNSNGEIQDRHLGKANYLLVDGSVGSMFKEELEAEYHKIAAPERSQFERE